MTSLVEGNEDDKGDKSSGNHSPEDEDECVTCLQLNTGEQDKSSELVSYGDIWVSEIWVISVESPLRYSLYASNILDKDSPESSSEMGVDVTNSSELAGEDGCIVSSVDGCEIILSPKPESGFGLPGLLVVTTFFFFAATGFFFGRTATVLLFLFLFTGVLFFGAN